MGNKRIEEIEELSLICYYWDDNLRIFIGNFLFFEKFGSEECVWMLNVWE